LLVSERHADRRGVPFNLLTCYTITMPWHDLNRGLHRYVSLSPLRWQLFWRMLTPALFSSCHWIANVKTHCTPLCSVYVYIHKIASKFRNLLNVSVCRTAKLMRSWVKSIPELHWSELLFSAVVMWINRFQQSDVLFW